MEVEFIFGVFGVDGWTLSKIASESVDNGILGFEGSVIGMGKDFARSGAVYHKGAVDIKNLLPPYAVYLVVQLLVVVGFKLGKRFQYGEGSAAGIVGAVE